jgi:hypothetical protein
MKPAEVRAFLEAVAVMVAMELLLVCDEMHAI